MFNPDRDGLPMGSYLMDGRPDLWVGRQCSFCLDLAMEASRGGARGKFLRLTRLPYS